jgi:hypothetical protein
MRPSPISADNLAFKSLGKSLGKLFAILLPEGTSPQRAKPNMRLASVANII